MELECQGIFQQVPAKSQWIQLYTDTRKRRNEHF